MKYYFNGIGIILFIAVVFGFALPSAISAKDTMMNIGGIGLAILAFPTLYVWIKALVVTKKKESKDEH